MTMNVERKEMNLLCSSSPYVDPVVFLDGNNINDSGNSNSHKTRLDYSLDYFKKFVRTLIALFLILVLLLFSTYQIILGCFNCGFGITNLGWIRASFFLNIPFVLSIFIYIVIRIRKKVMPSLSEVFAFVLIYMGFFGFYKYFVGIYGEFNEFLKIEAVLNSGTVVNFPCPMSYYHQVYVIMIVTWCIPLLLCVIGSVCSFTNRPARGIDNENNKCDRCAFLIVGDWINLTDKIFSRHKEEVFIRHL
jgi:hypothetical protein